MPLPVIADVFRVAVNYHIGTVPFTNVFHVHNASGNAEDSATTVGNAFENSSNLSALLSPNVTIDNAVSTPLDGSSTSFEHIIGGTGDHGSANNAPVQVCLVTTWLTNVRGRSHRGRTYLGGVANTLMESDGTKWKLSEATTFATAIDNFTDDLTAGDYPLHVASYKLAESFPVTTRRINLYLGTIRQRAESQE